MATPKEWVVICCPVSGKKTAVSVMERVFLPKCKELGLNVRMVLTERGGHATELAKEHGGKDRGLILVGGDGTLHEAMDGLMEIGKLQDVTLGILSQGTMNFYSHSGQLPGPEDLPKAMATHTFRKQSLMRIKDNSGQVDTHCFEAIYMGVGYRPAKGAQEWRHSLGPFFGIMYNLIKCNLFPASTSITGTLTLHPRDGSAPFKVRDTFFMILISQRSPYNGALTEDEMWVSYITLAKFPGFGRMMDCFSPPMELQSGCANIMEAHYAVRKFSFQQEGGNIGVCLDGDPTDAGTVLEGEHIPAAWNILADSEFPKRVSDEITRPCPLAPCAAEWLAKHPVPKDVYYVQPKAPAKSSSSLPAFLFAGLALGVATAALAAYFDVETEPAATLARAFRAALPNW